MAHEDVFGVLPSTFSVPVGATNAVLVQGLVNQIGSVLEQISGGSVYLLGVTAGMTASASELASQFNGGTAFFLIQTSKSISMDGSPRYYLMATGSTGVVQILNALGPGAPI